MSRADELFIENCKEILAHGVWDTEQEVRPRWADGAPAQMCIRDRGCTPLSGPPREPSEAVRVGKRRPSGGNELSGLPGSE